MEKIVADNVGDSIVFTLSAKRINGYNTDLFQCMQALPN